MDTGFSVSAVSIVMLAVGIWPIAHIPLGAPVLLAWQKEREIGFWNLAACLAGGQVFLSATTYLLYIFGFRFPTVGFLALAILFPLWVWGILLLVRSRWDISLPRWLLIGLAITMALILIRLIKGVIHDEGFHFPKVASIILGDPPYFVPKGTAGYQGAYHFGVDYLAAFWTWAIFPFRQWVPFNAMAFWSSAATYVLLGWFFRRFLPEPWASLSPFLAFWLGNWYSPVGLWGIILERRSLIAILMNAYNPMFFSYFIQAPMVFGFPLLLSALCLAEERRFSRAGLLAGPLLLANQALFAFLIGYSLISSLTKKRYIMTLLVALVLSAPFLPHLVVRGNLSDSPSFAFGLPILNLVDTGTASGLINYILFFFPVLPLYIHGAFLGFKDPARRAPLLPLLMITALLFLAPHFISYLHTGDFFKFFMLWGVFGLPITLLSLSELWQRSKLWKITLLAALLPGILSYLLGFGITSARTRRLVKWERVRPDIISAQNALRGKGGVLIINPPIRYISINKDTLEYSDGDAEERERLLMILGGAGIPHYPCGQIYGKARDDYAALIGPWLFLEDIPRSLLRSFGVGLIAFPSEKPSPDIADRKVLTIGKTAFYAIR
ncbi:MAG: hypothetical protein ABIM74_05570 [candidate division WOR-3 bacterium]